MKINIDNFIKKSIYFVVFYMITINFFCDFFKIPTIIRYVPDILFPFFLFYLCTKINYILKNKSIRGLLIISLIFLLHCIVGSIINNNSFFYFIWGFRNIFRFLIISLCALVVFDEKDKDKMIKYLHYMFIINVVLCFFQYFILGYWGDAIGGTFRLGASGGNAGLIYLIVIEITIITLYYLNNKYTLLKFLTTILISVLVAVIAELKIVYVFIVFIIILAIILNKFTFKNFLIIIGSLVFLLIGYNIVSIVDPSTAKILNVDGLLEYVGGESHGYSSADDINRLRAFNQIDKYFFTNNLDNKIWGYGLGHCDVSSFPIFNSTFAQKYDNWLHYTWFTHAMLYLETGMIGYLLYILLFVYIIVYCFKHRRKDKYNYSFYNITIIVSALSIMMTFYNSSLRNDISYFVYIFIILALCCNKKEGNKSDEKNMYIIDANDR